MAAETYAAAISAGGSIINGILGYKAADAAMAQEAQEARRNREFQEKMYNLQIQDQERLYNQYATPMAQRRMYEQAGLNPNLMLKNGNQVPGSPIQSGSVPSGAVGRGHMYQPNIDLSGFQAALLGEAQRENLQASTDAQNIKNRFAVTKEYLDIQDQLSRKGLTDEQRKQLELRGKMLEIELKYLDDFMKSRNETQKQEAFLKRNQALNEHYKGEYQKMVNEAYPQLNELQSRLLVNQSFAAYMSGVNSGASASLSYEMKRHEAIKAIGTTIENGVKANQFKLSDFGLSEAELNDMRNKGIIYRKKNSPAFDLVDGFVDYLTGIPGGVLRHLGK